MRDALDKVTVLVKLWTIFGQINESAKILTLVKQDIIGWKAKAFRYILANIKNEKTYNK